MIPAEELGRTPAWLPMRPAAADFSLVRLDEAGYRAASFLDERVFAGPVEQALGTRAALAEAAGARARRPPHYIFHIGHVGSTLVSRLVGEHAAIFSLREPLALRALADPATAEAALPLPVVLGLLARTWRDGQRAVVKATSLVNELAGPILAGADRPAAVFMFVDALTYLRSILAGPNSRREADAMAPGRRRRLARRAPGALAVAPDSLGERVAMNWLTEMLTLRQAAERGGPSALWVHFDRFLADPHAGLDAVLRTFGVDAGGAAIGAILAGPLMRRYSKAPEHAYDAALRRAVLQSADHEHRHEIARGLAWLSQAAAREPLARRVLDAHAGP